MRSPLRWRGEKAQADTAILRFVLQTLTYSPGFQSESQLASQAALRLVTSAAAIDTQLLATLPPSGLYPDITRANALLRQVVDCLTPKG